ncbi:lysophospholipase [Schizopora paradoxa]|uniref:Lysophospholipase n=1 Tax=Schizopora paradoxa TaxID=27342 RepID=A0A0H2RXF0_9AGAM|nr:lysophospholipase [Schizopora paradoxa]
MTDTPYSESWLAGPRNTIFYTRRYTPTSTPKALLVFMHGFIEHIGRYEHVFPSWRDRGISVFTLDQRGFGRTAEDKQHRSKDSSYGKTSDEDQAKDCEWAIKAARIGMDSVPTFLMGHSMGGGLVLSFASRPEFEPTVSSLSGVIATSPLIQQTHPTSPLLRAPGGLMSHVLPNMTIPAPVKADLLTHDAECNAAYLKDPLVKEKATLKCISDMFDRGDAILKSQYKSWPERLPVLICHGSADEVTSPMASNLFIEKIVASDKKLSIYEGGFHELHNEPNGVKEKLIEECISWVESHLPSSTPVARL